jgi:hypothetical protein
MKRRPNGFRQAVWTTLLLGMISAAALADQRPGLQFEPSAPLCYCHCAYEKGVKHCTKMCELPQFQNRWWAISCRKKAPAANHPASPVPNSGSKKTNRKEQAGL